MYVALRRLEREEEGKILPKLSFESAFTDNSLRQGGSEITRPLIIIGHSMGGIVAAKV
jgi:alpha-beta hydrolase superfamily lysophospholipase